MQETISSVEELSLFAKEIYIQQAKGEDHAALITLSGELGAGKTAFTKELAKQFGILDIITSPTFVLRKEYQLEGQKFKTFIHIDAYRLETVSELATINFEKGLSNPNNFMVLEWPEKVITNIPAYAQKIEIKVIDENTRIFSYEK